MPDELDAIRERNALLWKIGEDPSLCEDCGECLSCWTIRPCAAHDDSEDVDTLLAYVDRLRDLAAALEAELAEAQAHLAGKRT